MIDPTANRPVGAALTYGGAASEASGQHFHGSTASTTEVYERRIAALEGGAAAVATDTGAAARLLAITSLAGAGDEIVASPDIDSATRVQLDADLWQHGITACFALDATPAALAAQITVRTRALYVETLGAACLGVPDFEALARIAQGHGISLLVDNTRGAVGYTCRPLAHGADIVVASVSGGTGGYGPASGGVIIFGGNFDWASYKLPANTVSSPAQNGAVFAERSNSDAAYGHYNVALAMRARLDAGGVLVASPSPLLHGSLLLQGLETLSLRVQRSMDNALALARWLEGHHGVARVIYPGLAAHPSHALAGRYLRHGFGSTVAFELTGDRTRALAVVEGLRLVARHGGGGGARTQVTGPTMQMRHPDGEAPSRTSDLASYAIEVAVGIEYIDDLIADFQQALASAPAR